MKSCKLNEILGRDLIELQALADSHSSLSNFCGALGLHNRHAKKLADELTHKGLSLRWVVRSGRKSGHPSQEWGGTCSLEILRKLGREELNQMVREERNISNFLTRHRIHSRYKAALLELLASKEISEEFWSEQKSEASTLRSRRLLEKRMSQYPDGLFVKNCPLDRIAFSRFVRHYNRIAGWLEEKCECGNKGFWRGKKLTLQLDHKNGVNNDNRLENLRFLCPNCHSQTDTFCGRNKKRKVQT